MSLLLTSILISGFVFTYDEGAILPPESVQAVKEVCMEYGLSAITIKKVENKITEIHCTLPNE